MLIISTITLLTLLLLYCSLGLYIQFNHYHNNVPSSDYLKPRKTAALLVHGFADSPEQMVTLGKYLIEHETDVYYALIAGHGTTLKDFQKTSWKQWYKSLLDAYDAISHDYQRIVVIGFSMGANLTLLLSTERKIDKIVLSSPAIEFCGYWFLPGKPKTLIHILNNFLPFVPKIITGDIKEKKNLPLKGFGYHKYPLASLNELSLLMDEVMSKAGDVTAPCLILHSKNDKTVHYHGAEKLFRTINSSEKDLVLLDDKGHQILIDIGYEELYDKIREYIIK